MKHCFRLSALSLVFLLALAPVALAQDEEPAPDDPADIVDQQKRAQTGMKFLTVGMSPRATAMGGAATAFTEGTSMALLYNPASLSRMQSNFHANVGISQYIADINYNAATAAFRPGNGNYGVVGISFVNVDYGDFIRTVRSPNAPNDAGFIEVGSYTPTALAVGVGYARSFTDRFSAGAHVKYASQDLGTHILERVAAGAPNADQQLSDGSWGDEEDYAVNTVAVDFGVLYNTGFESLTIAMSVRNFSRELTYVREPFELPLTFQLGMTMNMVDLTSLDPSMHSLLLAVDAERPRDFTEHLRIGGEYTFMNILSLRAGLAQAFVESDATEEGFSLGAGLKYAVNNIGLGVDYAYTNFGLFGDLNRFAVQFAF